MSESGARQSTESMPDCAHIKRRALNREKREQGPRSGHKANTSAPTHVPV